MAKRPIFQEVSDLAPAAQLPQGGMIDAAPKGARGAIRAWLVVLFVMVAAMIALGGATRLTGSGLSITEWKPVTGVLPPQGEAACAISISGAAGRLTPDRLEALGARVAQAAGELTAMLGGTAPEG